MAQARESLPVKDERSTHCATPPMMRFTFRDGCFSSLVCIHCCIHLRSCFKEMSAWYLVAVNDTVDDGCVCYVLNSVKGPELLNMYVGQSEENVREGRVYLFHVMLYMQTVVTCGNEVVTGLWYTMFRKKRNHFIFDYNFRISRSILMILAPMETGINTP